MTPARYRQIGELFHAALAKKPGERSGFLHTASGSDAELLREVQSLLNAHGEAGSFIAMPALAVAAPAHTQVAASSFVGRQVWPYTIHALLGTGGMGEVYQARDSKLGRDVAIKILPGIFTIDPERRVRFDREARLLASLNHPHIGAIYGLEDMDGTPALILELVEGDTLAERIAKGPLPVAHVLHIARQIADALEAAHEKGITHRDLKPANIKITAAGVVKVLDFGLAKATVGDTTSRDLSQSPAAVGGTRDGVILGTAAYMSPEQARGKPVDKRTDIWAFGCLVYEMLTGSVAFPGDTISDTIASILGREPEWAVLATPAALRRLLQWCLEKDPKRRLRDIADARLQIEEALNDPLGSTAGNAPGPVHKARERAQWIAGMLAVGLGVAGISRYVGGSQPQGSEVRLEMNVPPTTDLTSFAISPDGRTLAFVATSDGKSRLWLRPLDGVSARLLAGTEGARFPFWSPDGRSVAFSTEAQLKRVEIDGGSVRVVVSGLALGGTWNKDGTILYDQGPGDQLYRVSADGGQPTAVTQRTVSVTDPWFPQFLPDQRHFLFYGAGTAPGIYIGRLDAADAPRLILNAQAATYASSGYLFFVRQGTLFAQTFDPVRLALAGSPMAVAEQAIVGQQGRAALSAAAVGPIVYRTGQSGAQSQFVWFDRSGQALETIPGSDNGDGYNSSLSRDGGRLAMSRWAGGTGDIWLLDLGRGVHSRFTDDPAYDLMPVWSPDGNRIAFTSNRKGADRFDLYVKSTAGPGDAELLAASDQATNPSDWSSDGKFILYVKQFGDIWAASPDGDRKPFPVVETKYTETNGQFSPDGKWIAYQSDESGRFEIYVQPFPGPGRETLVSSDGGIQARWRQDGKELFYLAPDNRLVAVPIRFDAAAASVAVGTPRPLFTTHPSGTPLNYMARSYMVNRDGQRFLVDTLKEVTLPITVILNWKARH